MAVLKTLRDLLPNMGYLVLELHKNYESHDVMDYAETNLIQIRSEEFCDVEFMVSFDDDVVNRIVT